MATVRRVLAEAWTAFLALNAAATAAVALLSLGGSWSARLDVLSHFAVIYATAGLTAALLAAPVRSVARPAAVALGGVAVAASLALMAGELLRNLPPLAPADAPGQLKIIQYNALRTNSAIAREVDWLISQQPDIVTITEARHDLRDLILARTNWSVAGSKGDLMIFSRSPRLAMNRPRPPGRPRLNFVNATYPSASGPFEVVTTHIDWPTTSFHAEEMRQLVGVTRELPLRRMILTGDFNSTPWSAELRRLDRGLGLSRRDKALLSYPADRRGFRWPWPVLPIDHVYAGPGWATVKVERGPRLGSDHYPVIVTLAPVPAR